MYVCVFMYTCSCVYAHVCLCVEVRGQWQVLLLRCCLSCYISPPHSHAGNLELND